MKQILLLLSVFSLALWTPAFAQRDTDQSQDNKQTTKQDEGKVADRAEAAARVLSEITSAPDKGIPGAVLSKAKCVLVIPGVKKAGFIVGGRYGRGFASCREANGWSAPAPVFLGGGSYGAQIGGEGVDLVLLVMNDQGVQKLLSSKVEIGVDASAAAGPVGRSVSAGTDVKMNSEILSYSRAKGLFAGVELNGAKLKQDNDSTKELYGHEVPFREILGGSVPTPPAAQPFVAEVQKDFAGAQTEK
jgi:SH3 domain-containing YSC84-like protein 1